MARDELSAPKVDGRANGSETAEAGGSSGAALAPFDATLGGVAVAFRFKL